MTAVPFPTLAPTGYVIPTDAEILAGVIADLQAAFGGALNLSLSNTSSLSTPQGQLASSFAAIISDCFSQFLTYVAQSDPQYAQGRMQDAIGNLYFMSRIQAQGTQVTGNCIGLAGTLIAAGVAVAVDAAGNLYSCTGGTIPSGGSLPMVFTNQVVGPLGFTAPLTIYQTTPGWDSVTGASMTLLGTNVETAQAFEARRSASVAVNASGSTGAIKAAVLASGASLLPSQVPTSAYVLDNPTSYSVVQGGITLPPNSVYVCAYQGNALAICQAIWAKKDMGCSYAPSVVFNGSISGTTLTVNSVTTGALAIGQTIAGGSIPVGVTIVGGSGSSWTISTSLAIGSEAMTAATTVTVYDTTYSTPQPSYQVSYTVPVVTPVNIQVTLAAASLPPSNALSLLQNATTGLGMAFTGADGLAPVSQIGATVYSSRLYPTIAKILPGVSVVNVQVGTGTPSANSQAININQIPSLGTVTLVLV